MASAAMCANDSILPSRICNIRNLFMRELETINVFDGGGNVTLAHPPCIHSQYFAFNRRHIALMFLYNLRFKLALTVPGDTNRDFAQRGFQCLLGIPVAGIGWIFWMPILFITEVILHFPFQYGFKDRAKNLLQGILYVLGIFKI